MEKRKPRILVVEESLELREALSGLLEWEGYVVDVANDTRAALEMLPRFVPDLILLDADRPDSGPELEHARRMGGAGATPLVVMSTSDRNPLLGVPAVARLRKPFDLDQLLDAIEPHLLVV